MAILRLDIHVPLRHFELGVALEQRAREPAPRRVVRRGRAHHAAADDGHVEDDVRRLGLGDRIVLRQNVAEIEDYFQAADVGLFTSESESFCLSILEAMNFGCPSVATAVGGIPEVVENGKSGLLVPFGDADGLARALESLIANPARLRAMGQAAKQRARALFSAAKIVPRYEALYRRVCAERGCCE